MMDDLTLYVSPSGDDGAAGSFDAPLGSLEEALRRLRGRTSPDAPGGIRLFGGEYRMRKTIVIPAENSFLSIRAVDGEKPVLTGSAALDTARFIPLSEAGGPQYAAKSRIPEAARAHVYAYDLGAEGIPAGSIQKNGFNWPQTACTPELICDGALQTLAQWPNDRDLDRDDLVAGWDKPPVLERYTEAYWARYHAAHASGARVGTIARDYFSDKCENPRSFDELLAMDGPRLYCVSNELAKHAARWGRDQEPDGWLCGYFGNNYANDMTPIEGYDGDRRLLCLSQPVMYGVADRWIKVRGRNLLCELDAPGEYYIDRQDGRSVLYYWPEGDNLSGKSIELKSFDREFLRLEGARGVVIEGLTFTAGTGHGVVLLDCEDCVIRGCECYNFSLDAVRIGMNNGAITTDPAYEVLRGGHRNRVTGCRIHDMGGGGVYCAGGDRRTLERAGHVVSGCEFWNLSMLRTYTPAVYLEGVGSAARDNYIHDCPHMVIQIMGNDMLILRNRIENVCRNASDQGAIYAGRCQTWLGNVIEGNLIRRVGRYDDHGVYLDDGMSGAVIRRNLIEDVSGACVFSNCGFGQIIEDNIFITENPAVRIWSQPFKRPIPNENVLKPRFDAMLDPAQNAPGNIENWFRHYAKDYPWLPKLRFPDEAAGHPDDPDCAFRPGHWRFGGNVVIGGGRLHDAGEGFLRYYDGDIGKPLFAAESAEALGLDIETGLIDENSPLAGDGDFGPGWIEAWNEAIRGKADEHGQE